MVTIADIACQTGYSTATVSNALTGKGRVSEDRRKEIRAAAEAMGYDYSRIRAGQSRKSIAVVIEQVGVCFCDRITQGVCQAAEEKGFSTTLYNLNLLIQTDWKQNPPQGLVKAEFRKVLNRLDASCLGLIYVSQYTRDVSGLFTALSVPVVCTYAYTSDGIPSINYDDQHGAYLATSRLASIGRRQIAMISGFVDSIPVTKRFAGYQRALIDAGLIFSPDYIKIGDWTPESGESEMEKLLAQSPRPDAVFCQNDWMAVGAMRAVKKAGLRIPEDIAIAGFDNTDVSEATDPPLTTVAPPHTEIGREAVAMLAQILNKSIGGKENTRLPCGLILRGTA